MPISREDIEKLLGPVDDHLAAEVAATDATAEELASAIAWINADEALINEGRPLPTGRVAELIGLLEPVMDEDDLA